MMKFKLPSVFLMCCLCSCAFGQAAENSVPVRLVGGTGDFEGRVEVFYNGEWGTVCDDVFDSDSNGCAVVCSQLGYSGGAKFQSFGAGTDEKIWLDGVKCQGDEGHLGACMHNFWGEQDCDHPEDAGCVCELKAPGSCDRGRHRLTAFNSQYPAIGRVEIRNQDGDWQTVCDDHWDDNDAAVFCQCLGYSNSEHFRAYWSGRLVDLRPELPMGYDGVYCTSTDRRQNINLWECNNTLEAGRCDPRLEAAAVACQEIPKTTLPTAPSVSLQCDGQLLSVCFESKEYLMRRDYLSIDPGCISATTRQSRDGVCLDVKMDSCKTSMAQTDSSFKNYCYDISYSEYDRDPATLQTDEVWLRRSCCSIAKNGTVTTSLLPRVGSHSSRTLYTAANTTFSLQCFTDADLNTGVLTPFTDIQRGQDLFCRVQADTWDPRMYLVVPSCRFHATAAGQPAYDFLQNKCPTIDDLEVTYFGYHSHSWGFHFKVPKFQGYDQLFISCDTYICDSRTDPKPYCDRSCLQEGATRDRKRRATAAATVAASNEDTVRLTGGPYTVENTGFGPLITSSGKVRVVSATGISPNPPENSEKRNPLWRHKAEDKKASGLSSSPRCDLQMTLNWAVILSCLLRKLL